MFPGTLENTSTWKSIWFLWIYSLINSRSSWGRGQTGVDPAWPRGVGAKNPAGAGVKIFCRGHAPGGAGVEFFFRGFDPGGAGVIKRGRGFDPSCYGAMKRGRGFDPSCYGAKKRGPGFDPSCYGAIKRGRGRGLNGVDPVTPFGPVFYKNSGVGPAIRVTWKHRLDFPSGNF